MEMNIIFKALSDPGRRKILDIVKKYPGINVNELSDNFEYSRFAVMKHLKLLETANLIVPQKDGKNKKLYINVIPIQSIYDRWISQFGQFWASNLNTLKYKLEMEENMSSSEIKQVYVTYIKSTREKVWNALTNGELTQMYYYGTKVTSTFEKGSKIEYVRAGAPEAPVFGEIVEFVPMEKFSHTFFMVGYNEGATLAEYRLEEENDLIKLTLVHSGFSSDSSLFENVAGGWPLIFSGLKTLLETGSPM